MNPLERSQRTVSSGAGGGSFHPPEEHRPRLRHRLRGTGASQLGQRLLRRGSAERGIGPRAPHCDDKNL
jgi:hypothetical protein